MDKIKNHEFVLDLMSVYSVTAQDFKFHHRINCHVLIYKDTYKRSYFLLILNSIREVLAENIRISKDNIERIKINNKDPSNLVLSLSTKNNKLISITFHTEDDKNLFHNKIKECIKDVNLENDSILVGNASKENSTSRKHDSILTKIPKLNDFEKIDANKKTRLKSDQVRELILNTQQSKKTPELSNPSIPKATAPPIVPKIDSNPVTASSPCLPVKSFYASSIDKRQHVIENLTLFENNSTNFTSTTQSTTNNKIPDEPSPLTLKRRREDTLDNLNKLDASPVCPASPTTTIASQSTPLPNLNFYSSMSNPKRNCSFVNSDFRIPKLTSPSLNDKAITFDLDDDCKKKPLEINLENQENENVNLVDSSNTWNRNSSLGKSFGKGFSNLGNTCYMNSILQCLLNIDIFVNDLMANYCLFKSSMKPIQTLRIKENNINSINNSDNAENSENNENMNEINNQTTTIPAMFTLKTSASKIQECLYYCLCELIRSRENLNEVHQLQWLRQIKITISLEATRFSGYRQHDAHEFLCQVLDQLKDDMDKLKKKLAIEPTNHQASACDDLTPVISTPINDNDDTDKHENDTPFINPVVDNFQFDVIHAIQCKKCNHTITKREEYNNLCLELPSIQACKNESNPHISLQDTLDIFFRDEQLDDFKCEKCSARDVLIERKFAKLPRVLILHLKRYQYQEVKSSPNADTRFELVKNDLPIDIPRYLTLKWCLSNDDTLKTPKKSMTPLKLKTMGLKQANLNSLKKPLDESMLNQSVNLASTTSSHKLATLTRTIAKSVTPNIKTFTPSTTTYAASTTNCSLSANSYTPSTPTSTATNSTSTRTPSRSVARRIALLPLNENINKSLVKEKVSKSPAIYSDLDVLPDLRANENKYDRNSFTLDKLTEDDQVNMAIERSLVEVESSSSMNDNMAFPKYVDGPFDNDENGVDDSSPAQHVPEESTSKINSSLITSDESSMSLSSLKNKETNDNSDNNANIIADNNNSNNDADHEAFDTFDGVVQKPVKTYMAPRKTVEKKKKLYSATNNYNDLMMKSSLIENRINDPFEANDKASIKPFEVELSQESISNDIKQSQKPLDEFKSPVTSPVKFMQRSESKQRLVDSNALTGAEKHSYRIISIVNHLGSTSNSGHYISDVYDTKLKTWSSYDDTSVENLSEQFVLRDRSRTGYIFFYIHNSLET